MAACATGSGRPTRPQKGGAVRASPGGSTTGWRLRLDLLLPPVRPGAPGLAFERLDNGSARITLGGLDAAAVELMGDFTGWEPIALVRSGQSEWTATVPIPAGIHRVNLRVDGGQWIVQP